MFWQIASFPKCTSHIFLSHSQEDRENLVQPIYDGLLAEGIQPWMDRADYSYGRDSRSALRDGVLRSRHIAFFVTDAMLNNSRGWCCYELAFAELMQINLKHPGGQLANVLLTLYLVDRNDMRLSRSVWQLASDLGNFYDPTSNTTRCEWCIQEIKRFLIREQELSLEVALMSKHDEKMARLLSQTHGLKDRVTRFHPAKIPPQ